MDSNPGPDRMFVIEVMHNYAVLHTVQMSGMWSDIYGTVHYKEHLTSFDKSRA